jgi:hypothetical protein
MEPSAMMIIMFVTLVSMGCVIAWMQYLGLCEQRRTQHQLARVNEAVERFERRQFLARPIIQTEEEFDLGNVFNIAWANYERVAA